MIQSKLEFSHRKFISGFSFCLQLLPSSVVHSQMLWVGVFSLSSQLLVRVSFLHTNEETLFYVRLSKINVENLVRYY